MNVQVSAILSDPDVSHTMWRVTRPFKRMRETGFGAVHYNLGPKGTDGVRWYDGIQDVLKQLDLGDIVLLPRVYVAPEDQQDFETFVEWANAQSILVVYETDDDTVSQAWIQHHRDCNSNLIPGDIRRLYNDILNTRFVINAVNAVITSTNHLGMLLSQYTSKPVFVVPNAIDVDAFESGLTQVSKKETIVVGWAAGYRPEADAEYVAKAWRRIAHDARFDNVNFVVAGWALRNLVEAIPYGRLKILPFRDMYAYPTSMQVDIGCVSVADTVFNQSRGPGKLWEFTLAGAAVVYGGVTYDPAIIGSFPGLWSIGDGWYDNLVKLIENPQLRYTMNEQAKAEVYNKHALENSLWAWFEAFTMIKRQQRRQSMASV